MNISPADGFFSCPSHRIASRITYCSQLKENVADVGAPPNLQKPAPAFMPTLPTCTADRERGVMEAFRAAPEYWLT